MNFEKISYDDLIADRNMTESEFIKIQDHEINDLIKNAYEISQKKNISYTWSEANQYDPLISTLYKLMKLKGLKFE